MAETRASTLLLNQFAAICCSAQRNSRRSAKGGAGAQRSKLEIPTHDVSQNLQRQIEAQFSPAVQPGILDFKEITRAMELARYMRAQQAGVLFRALGQWLRQGPLKGLIARMERRRALDHLYSMDDRMLRDIGLSRAEIAAVVRQGRAPDSSYIAASLQNGGVARGDAKSTLRDAA